MGMRHFPGGPVIRTLPYNIAGAGLIPGQRTRIPRATTESSHVIAEKISSATNRKKKILNATTTNQCSQKQKQKQKTTARPRVLFKG